MPIPIRRLSRLAMTTALVCAPFAALAQTATSVPSPGAETATPDQTEQITVIGTSPLLGSGIDRDQVPAATTVLGPADIDRTDIPSLTSALLDNIPAATVNGTEGNTYQPDILFRGFIASPVAGTPQGLAVYVNGARFNDPFGDTVNWDVIPAIAINKVNVEGSNPIFGLNALGGSVSVQLKNGFTNPGGDVTAYGGSYGTGSGSVEYGRQYGNFAVYGAGEILNDQGFRETQQSQIYRLNTDLGWRNDIAEVHLNVTAADNTLGNPGAAPVQLVDTNPAYIFTAPNDTYNKYVAVNLNGNIHLNDDTTLQAVSYFQNLTQRIPNGATPSVENCGTIAPGLLCNDDGTVATGRGGVPIPAFEPDNLYSALATLGLDSHAYGASAQVTNRTPIFGLKNHLVAGASFDGSASVFNGNTEDGGYNPENFEFVSPGITQDQPSEGVNPVRVASFTRYFGVFASEILTILPKLDLSVGGRFNNAEVDLGDKNGGPVTGQHSYNRFNPDIGLTWRFRPALQFYAGYSEANRVPTPQELSCASAAFPCSLLNFFVGDPNLKQVVARTVEAGARGKLPNLAGGAASWDIDLYRTKDHDDLIDETTTYNPTLAYFTNAGITLRQGVDADLNYDIGTLHLSLGYAYTDAVFESSLLLGSDSNPAADANGNIHVTSGDRIPGIPTNRGTVVIEDHVTERWLVGGNLTLENAQYRYGDEANQEKPVGGYVVLNLNTSYKLTEWCSVFGVVNNATNQFYATYGSFGPVTSIPFPQVKTGVTDPRTESLGQPVSGYGGVKVTF